MHGASLKARQRTYKKKSYFRESFAKKNINIRELEKKLSRDPRSCHPRLLTLKTLTRTFWITPKYLENLDDTGNHLLHKAHELFCANHHMTGMTFSSDGCFRVGIFLPTALRVYSSLLKGKHYICFQPPGGLGSLQIYPKNPPG